MVTLVFSRAVQKFLLTYLLTYLHLADFSAAEICQQEHSHPCVLAGVLLALTLTAL